MIFPSVITDTHSARSRLRLVAGVAASALLLSVLSSCGYTFSSSAGPLPKANGRPVEVAVFRSLVNEADAGILLSRAIAEELATRGALRGNGAPVLLEGTVELLRFEPVGIAPQGVSTWRAHVRASVVLRDRGDGESAPAELQRATLSEWEEYLGGVDIESTEVSRRMAMSRMFRRLAESAANVLSVP